MQSGPLLQQLDLYALVAEPRKTNTSLEGCFQAEKPCMGSVFLLSHAVCSLSWWGLALEVLYLLSQYKMSGRSLTQLISVMITGLSPHSVYPRLCIATLLTKPRLS